MNSQSSIIVPKVSVIIPIYNVERYIGRCARSLFEQTLDNIEYIFVDDCSPDHSIAVLLSLIEKFPERKEQIRIIRHPRNLGLSSARNTGLSAARGQYVAHCDSDDWVDARFYEIMYNEAVSRNSDIVYCDLMMVFAEKSCICQLPDWSNNKIDSFKKFLSSSWTCLVTTFAKRDLYYRNNLCSPTHITFCEDFWLTSRLFYYAVRISKVKLPLYYYNRENESSILHGLNAKSQKEEIACYVETITFLKEKGVYELFEREMMWRLIKSTADGLYRDRMDIYEKYYLESKKYIISCPFINVKTKILLFLLTIGLKAPVRTILRFRKILGR